MEYNALLLKIMVVHSFIAFFFFPSNSKLFLAVFSAVLGNFTFGYALVYPSPVIPYLEVDDNPNLRMDTSHISWFGVRTKRKPVYKH